MRRVLLFSCLTLTLFACAPMPTDPSVVRDFRILAVRANPPELAPGESTTLSALVVDPLGAGRTVTLGWGLCIPDPLLGLAACNDPERATPLGIGDGLTWTVPMSALDGLDPAAAEVGLDALVLLTAFVGNPQDPEEMIIGVKRVRMSTNPVPNANPTLASFAIDEVAVGTTEPLEASVADGSSESFSDPERGVIRETLRFSWLATQPAMGRLHSLADDEGLGTNSWTRASADAATVWVVVRDGRGGVSWAQAEVQSALP